MQNVFMMMAIVVMTTTVYPAKAKIVHHFDSRHGVG